MPVKVAVKRNALFFYLSELCQRENLKSAAVGQNGSVPMNELVKSARFRDKFVAGSDVQMICVAQKHLAAERFQVVRADGAFYCARGSHVHENRRLHRAMDGLEFAETRVSFLFYKCIHSFAFQYGVPVFFNK